MSLTPSRCNRRPGDGAGRLVVCNICVTVYRIIKDPKFLIPGAPRERLCLSPPSGAASTTRNLGSIRGFLCVK
jgi:hypothetical protein